MLTIRLQRVGRKNDPSYRVVLTDRLNAPQSGKFKEILGSYDPRNDAPQLKADRITHWIAQGAQTSDTVHNLLISQKIIEGKKKNVLPRKSPVVDEEALKKTEEEKQAQINADTTEAQSDAEGEAPAEEVAPEETHETETPAETEEVQEPAPEETPAAEETAEVSTEESQEK